MFYLKFLKDKYKVPYICGTSKDKNHYHIHEKPQTILPKTLPPNTKSDPILIGLIFFFEGHTLGRLGSIELLAHPKVRP